MEAQHVLDLEQPLVQVAHLGSQLLGVAVEGDAGLAEGLELQAVRPLPDLHGFIQRFDGLRELEAQRLDALLVQILLEELQMQLHFLRKRDGTLVAVRVCLVSSSSVLSWSASVYSFPLVFLKEEEEERNMPLAVCGLKLLLELLGRNPSAVDTMRFLLNLTSEVAGRE